MGESEILLVTQAHTTVIDRIDRNLYQAAGASNSAMVASTHLPTSCLSGSGMRFFRSGSQKPYLI
jgi:hypothetical protein